jgi:DNA polymerase (family 10)
MPRANDDVEALLQEYSDLISISGGDAFKARAYEKAARAVGGYHGDVEKLDLKGLQAIPNVGKSIAEKIQEYLETGAIQALEDLRWDIPDGVRSMIAVPGLGPKKAMVLFEELKISSMEELLDALHAQKLRDVRGFGAKTEENILRGIRQMQKAGGRVQLGAAIDLAEEILTELKSLPEVVRADYAGSLRRMCDTIGDIDLLVASEKSGPVMEAFASMPYVQGVLAKGETKSSILTTKGLQVDVRVVSPEVWGAALQYFTGSKAHNVRIREMAVRKGLKLSEYGLFQAKSGELPQVLQEREIKGDLHTHTNLTDGLAPLEEMIDAARARRYAYYAVTDHAELLYMQRMTREKALAQRKRIRQLEKTGKMAILHGSELNIQPDGSLDWDEDFLSDFDVLVAAVHSHFNQSKDDMTRRIVKAMEHPLVNIIGHPTGRLIGRRPPLEFDLETVFKAAARTGTALEVNSFPDRLDLRDEHLLWAREHGAKFAVSTDAHAPVHLPHIRFGVATAQRGWVTKADVINSYPLTKLRRFLAKGRARG